MEAQKKPANDIRVGFNTRIGGIIRYCDKLITQDNMKELNFSAVGGSIGTLVTTVEILKTLHKGLYQVNRFATITYQSVEEGKKREIGIVMDLVVNHCSDEHEWFTKACADPDGEYGKYFYIENHKDGEPLPCNWRSYFGGNVWDKLPGHDDKIYLHVFHKKQPDLNWENPKLRREIYKMINWWLDRGIAGFRIDAIINIKKKLPFSDYPADRDDGMTSMNNMLAEATGIGEFLDEMANETFRKYQAFSVGEVLVQIDPFIGARSFACSSNPVAIIVTFTSSSNDSSKLIPQIISASGSRISSTIFAAS